MIRLIFSAIFFGLVFGLGFWVGRITEVLPEVNKQNNTPEGREKMLKSIQKRLEFSYYRELIKKPEQIVEEVSQTGGEIKKNLESSVSSIGRLNEALAKVLGDET